MYNFQEFEYILEDAMGAGLGYTMFANFGSGILGIVSYVLSSLALYTIAQRRCIKNAWFSWIPVLNCWIIGSLSDQYRYVARGEVKNKRKTLLALNIARAVIASVVVILAAVICVLLIGGLISGDADAIMEESALVPLIIIAVLSLPLIGISIASVVFHYMAMYDIYTSCTPANNVVFLVLSIFFNITEPFFLFFTRNRDDGMPPRKQEPIYNTYQEPVYNPPREPWDNTEQL